MKTSSSIRRASERRAYRLNQSSCLLHKSLPESCRRYSDSLRQSLFGLREQEIAALYPVRIGLRCSSLDYFRLSTRFGAYSKNLSSTIGASIPVARSSGGRGTRRRPRVY